MEKAIEIPFGAKDSELKGWEYTIPKGMEAEIKDGKIIVKQKESEDERIRSLLVWQVHRNIEDETNDLAGSVYDGIKGHDPDLEESIEDWKKCLAYLERLKEQKPVMIQWTGKNLKEVIDFTGKSQKFGEWFKSWEDFENYVHIHDDIIKLFCEDGSHYEVPVGAWIVKTPDGYNTPSRFRFIQKPAEWSLTDATFIEEIDETLFMAEAGRNEVVKNQIERERNWLKSLPDNYKKCNSRWKPSEEQMAALLNAEGLVRANNYQENAKILASLYEDLKKL